MLNKERNVYAASYLIQLGSSGFSHYEIVLSYLLHVITLKACQVGVAHISEPRATIPFRNRSVKVHKGPAYSLSHWKNLTESATDENIVYDTQPVPGARAVRESYVGKNSP